MSRLLAAPVIGLVLVLAACGGDEDDGNASTSGNDSETTLEITAPADGDEVSAPFTVEFDSSEELGATEDGVHHVHIYWDGDDSEYTVVEAESVEVTEVPAEGEHVLNASLRHADHSPAGVETEITVNVTGGDDGDSGDDGGLGY
jgi:hypothetical protein